MSDERGNIMTVKDELLKMLEENGGKELSGQAIADRLGVSRSAVWKAISSLNKEGCRIEAGRGTGYRLVESGDLLSPERVRFFLPEKMKKNQIIVLKTVDSTNTFAKKAAADGAGHGTLIIAEEQTGGRGRRGNSFYSPSGTGLYMTVILRPGAADVDLITVCAGCGACRAIETITGKKPLIKWVNDLYLDGKKICGILSEATFDYEAKTIDSVVVGIGINISTDTFPLGLDQKAGKIGAPIERAVLAAKVTECFIECLERSREENIADYKSRSLVLNRKVSFVKDGVEHLATAVDIDMKGRLIVESEGGVMTLNSGEISVKL